MLVAGSTGSGKSTTLAAMIEHINSNFKKHIITLEDPIEFVFEDNQSVIEQREIGLDTANFHGALSYAGGIFDGSPDYNSTTTNSDYDDNKAFAGRVFAQPWKTSGVAWLQGLGFVAGGSYEVDRATATTVGTGLTPGYATDGQQKFFTYATGVFANGTHWRLSPQAYYYYGPVSYTHLDVYKRQRP